MTKKPKTRTATVQGAVYTYEGEMVDRPVGIRLTSGPNRDAVDGPVIDDRGGYVFRGIDAGKLYWVEIEESPGRWSVGLPSAFRPEEGLNHRCFLMPPSEETTATVSGKVLASNGDDLRGEQTMRWARASDGFWVTSEFTTTDNGSYQTYEVLVPLGITYSVYVNRGLAVPDQYCPEDIYNENVDFRRQSGTACTTTVVHSTGDRLWWWKWTGDSYVKASYAFEVLSSSADELVSLPHGERYKAKIKESGGDWKWSSDPRWELPHRTGTGSDEKKWNKQET